MPLTTTKEQISEFAPKAKKAYVDALMANLEVLEDAGILENKFRLCHFFAQVGEETAGLSAFRENLKHSPASARKAWPSRFARKGDAELRELIRDQVRFADAVYGGRLGNRKGTSDAYDFRGGGWHQITGRANVESLCKDLGIPVTADVLDDPVITLRMACRYWEKNGCNAWADKNDVLKVSKIINTGSATSAVKVVGLEHRKEWLARAMAVWGDAEPLAQVADVKAADLDSRTIRDATVMKVTGGATAVGSVAKALHEINAPAAPPVPAINLPEVADKITALDRVLDGVSEVSKFAVTNYWIAGLVIGAVVWWYGRRSVRRYLEDVRTGRHEPIFKVTKKIAEAIG